MTSIHGNTLEKLKDRENFDAWKVSATSYLVISGLWKYTQYLFLSGILSFWTEIFFDLKRVIFNINSPF